jgi:hypothetical protein
VSTRIDRASFLDVESDFIGEGRLFRVASTINPLLGRLFLKRGLQGWVGLRVAAPDGFPAHSGSFCRSGSVCPDCSDINILSRDNGLPYSGGLSVLRDGSAREA